MELHNLRNINEKRKSRKRKGIGVGTGLGKTSGRGHKGMKARSGGSVRPGFEGGQMPLYRKLPHRGFSNFKFRKNFSIVNVGDLERIEGDSVNYESLLAAGLIRSSAGLIKILGDGETTRPFKVSVDAISASAKSKIEAAGGSIESAAPAEGGENGA